MADDDKGWFYCLDHQTVEPWDGCKSANRLGPYATRDDASHALEKVAERNQQLDDEDAAWEGDR